MIKKCIALILALSFLNGCLYINVKEPLDTDMNVTKVGSKVGTSYTKSVCWLVAWGDGSTATAARNGDIHTINMLDQQIFSVFFGVYTKHTVIAYGD